MVSINTTEVGVFCALILTQIDSAKETLCYRLCFSVRDVTVTESALSDLFSKLVMNDVYCRD